MDYTMAIVSRMILVLVFYSTSKLWYLRTDRYVFFEISYITVQLMDAQHILLGEKYLYFVCKSIFKWVRKEKRKEKRMMRGKLISKTILAEAQNKPAATDVTDTFLYLLANLRCLIHEKSC